MPSLILSCKTKLITILQRILCYVAIAKVCHFELLSACQRYNFAIILNYQNFYILLPNYQECPKTSLLSNSLLYISCKYYILEMICLTASIMDISDGFLIA